MGFRLSIVFSGEVILFFEFFPIVQALRKKRKAAWVYTAGRCLVPRISLLRLGKASLALIFSQIFRIIGQLVEPQLDNPGALNSVLDSVCVLQLALAAVCFVPYLGHLDWVILKRVFQTFTFWFVSFYMILSIAASAFALVHTFLFGSNLTPNSTWYSICTAEGSSLRQP